MKHMIKNAVYQMYRNHDLDTSEFEGAINGISEVCLYELSEHPELIPALKESEQALHFFVEQMMLEQWQIRQEVLQQLIDKALFIPEGVEKGKKSYEAYHEGIIEHTVKDVFICIETDQGNLMASGVGRNFFPNISGAINAINSANIKLSRDMNEETIKKLKEAERQGEIDFNRRFNELKEEYADWRGWSKDNPAWNKNDKNLHEAECYAYEFLKQEFFLGDKVKVDYISDCNPHNSKVGTITWLHKCKFYPHGDKTESETRVQGTITYDDGTTESIGNFYRKGSGLVSPVVKVLLKGGAT